MAMANTRLRRCIQVIDTCLGAGGSVLAGGLDPPRPRRAGVTAPRRRLAAEASSRAPAIDAPFVSLWENVIHIFHEVAAEYDQKWRVRKRVIDTLMLMLLIFRLVCSKNTQSYGTTIDELWNNCKQLKWPLPQKSSIAPSSFCAARQKLDETVL